MNWTVVQPDQFPRMFELRVYVDICIKWIDRRATVVLIFLPATEELCGNNVTGHFLTERRRPAPPRPTASLSSTRPGLQINVRRAEKPSVRRRKPSSFSASGSRIRDPAVVSLGV